MGMKYIFTAVFLLLLAAPAWGQDFKKGVQAYEGGDYAAALQEWRPLAEQGHADAQFNLGIMYANGQGVPQDDAEAWKWWRKALALGDADTQDVSRLLVEGLNETHAKGVVACVAPGPGGRRAGAVPAARGGDRQVTAGLRRNRPGAGSWQSRPIGHGVVRQQDR